MPDYADVARKLRAKAADPAVSGPERDALLAKATELDTKYPAVTVQSFFYAPGDMWMNFNDTTVTSRSGQTTTYRNGKTEWRARYYDEADLIEDGWAYDDNIAENEDW
jgi:hypothetical protein